MMLNYIHKQVIEILFKNYIKCLYEIKKMKLYFKH